MAAANRIAFYQFFVRLLYVWESQRALFYIHHFNMVMHTKGDGSSLV